MNLINEKIYIDLENYLDMESFNAIEDQICYNIAKFETNARAMVFNTIN